MTLNEFSGVSTRTLEAKLRKAQRRYEQMLKAVDDGEFVGGSPFESIHEELDALEAELHRRAVERS